MAIVRWDPLGELTHLQERINHVFSDYGRGPGSSRNDEGLMTTGAWAPPVDIYQDGDQGLVLTAELPDVAPEDVQLTIDNDTLTIRGEKRLNGVNEEQFHRIERRYGTFSRSFSFPTSIDATKVSAEHKNGVLTVRLPARDEAKPRQIKVKISG